MKKGQAMEILYYHDVLRYLQARKSVRKAKQDIL